MMADPFDLPPGTERASITRDRLAFADTPNGTRRLVRIARVAHVEQHLTVEPRLHTGDVAFRQHFAGAHTSPDEDTVLIRMAPEEARRIASLLLAGADEVDAAEAQRIGDGEL